MDAGESATGGASTVRGIIYQMLWSLLRATRAHILRATFDGENEESATLVLEPTGGGGDLVFSAGRRSVEQIKARADGGAWSLRAIAEKVLPDLYRDGDRTTDDTLFRFVTEGHQGDWDKVAQFFESLRDREPPEEDVLSALDDEVELPFRRGKPAKETFWSEESYTERSLFERIVVEVRKHKDIVRNEDAEGTRRNLWRLLANFEFVGRRSLGDIVAEIDALLLGVVDRNDDVVRIRQAMACDLADRAATGNAVVDVREFLEKHDLRATPLVQWARLRELAARRVDLFLEDRHDPNCDVRCDAARADLADWPPVASILAIGGGTGRGKSWRAFGVARAATAGLEVVVVVDATETLDATLRRAAGVLWQEVAGHNNELTLQSIAARLRSTTGDGLETWLTLVVDGVGSREFAQGLLRQPWREWGVRLVVTVPTVLAAWMREHGGGRCHHVEVGDFTLGELHEFLDRSIGPGWTLIPDDVRETLRWPLLADTYRRIATGTDWVPESEYGLFDRFWRRLFEFPMDGAALKELVRRGLAGTPYPWSDDTAREVGGTDEMRLRMEKCGWLRDVGQPGRPRFEIAHDRLLNWAVAVTYVDDLRDGRIGLDELGTALRRCERGELTISARRLHYVPMDVLWLLCGENQASSESEAVLAALDDGRDFRRAEILYEELVPTLGSRAVDLLFRRLRDLIEDDWRSRRMERGLVRIDASSVREGARELLFDEDCRLQRSALRVLAGCPCPGVLDRLWELHALAGREPEPFLREHDSRHQVYEDTFAALRACISLDPDWLATAIERTNPEEEPVHDLAYLVLAVDGERGRVLWKGGRETLFERIAPNRARALAMCLAVHGDESDVPWLVEQLSQTDDLLGAAALRALARIAPETAIQHIGSLPPGELQVSRQWFTSLLFAAHGPSMRRRLLELMRERDDPWPIAYVYIDREHDIDEETLNLLLDDVAVRMEEALRMPDWGDVEPLMRPLRFLGGLHSLAHHEVLERRRNTVLEERLVEFARRIGPRRGRSNDSMVRESIVDLLRRIGGRGYVEVVNRHLADDSFHARWEGTRLAATGHDEETNRLLVSVAGREEPQDASIMLRNDAVELLIEFDIWEPVIEYIREQGLQCSSKTTDAARFGRRPPADFLDETRQLIAAHEAKPGWMVALGFGDVERDARIVRDVLAGASPESEVARACAVALEMLGDRDETSVPLLVPLLSVGGNHEWSAKRALAQNGTATALRACFDHGRDTFDYVAIVNSLNLDPNGVELVPAVCEEIAEAASGRRIVLQPSWELRLQVVVDRLRDRNLPPRILDSPATIEQLRATAFAAEGPIRVVGERDAAIRCLAIVDPRSGWTAAEVALRGSSATDRGRFARTLIKLDAERAIPVLVELIGEAESERFVASIGRTLTLVDCDSAILAAIESPDQERRQSACIAAGWAGRSASIEAALRARLDDEDGVARVAANALDRLGVRRETRRLVDAIETEQDSNRRWVLLDALLQLADPSEAYLPWPLEEVELNSLSRRQISYVTDVLKRRRSRDESPR